MPVLICGAATAVGRRIAESLLDKGGEVRLFGSGDVEDLRPRGAFVSYGTWDDEGRLEAALTDVHTLVVVPNGYHQPVEHAAAAAAVAAKAATNADVQRVIMVSALARPHSTEPYRTALWEAECQLASVPAPTLIMRSNLIASPRLVDALLTADLDGLDDVPVAPVQIDDLAALVVAYDQARAASRDGTLTVRVNGPTHLTFGQYRAAVQRRFAGAGRLGRRLISPGESAALKSFVADGFADELADIDAFELVGLHPTASVEVQP